MNMQVLKPSRKRLSPGDVFIYCIREFGFGRVIRTDCMEERDTILIYIYRAFSRTRNPPALSRDELLVPPMLINRLPWSRGYFETIENRSLKSENVLAVHCFDDSINDCFVDEYGRRLPKRVEPCGLYGLNSFVTADVAISMALGITPHPDTLPP